MPKNTDIRSILIVAVIFFNFLALSSCNGKAQPEIMSQNDAAVISKKCDLPLDNFLFSWTESDLTQSQYYISLRVTKADELIPVIKASDDGSNLACIEYQRSELNILMNIAVPSNKSENNAKKY